MVFQLEAFAIEIMLGGLKAFGGLVNIIRLSSFTHSQIISKIFLGEMRLCPLVGCSGYFRWFQMSLVFCSLNGGVDV